MISKRISDDIPPQMKILNMAIPIPKALLQFPLKLEYCKPYKAAHHPAICDIIYDAKLFLTVYCRIYCGRFLMLSNQTSSYKIKCIRISKFLSRLPAAYSS